MPQREFWIGAGAATIEQLNERYGGPKPCLHGCDAHDLARVGQPDENRRCFIKGRATFDSLRQACIDPSRAIVGENPPSGAHPSQTIARVQLHDAPWAKTPEIELNPGLIAIIGARGSGKTALADAIALGCDAVSGQLTESSFLERARPLLADATATLTWEEGEHVRRRLDCSDVESSSDYPRARYLSQKFVEQLCSAHEMTDSLLREVERVVFDAHSAADQDGTSSFDELLELRAARYREGRAREEASLAQLSEEFGIEREKETRLPDLRKQLSEKKKLIEGYIRDRKKLVAKGSEARMERLTTLTSAADRLREGIGRLKRREQSLLSLQDSVVSFRDYHVTDELQRLKEKHRAAGLTESQWAAFALQYAGDVDAHIASKLESVRRRIDRWTGVIVDVPDTDEDPLVPDDANLKRIALSMLDAEISRLQRLVSADKVTAQKFASISGKITQELTARNKLDELVKDCEGATERKRRLLERRQAVYVRVFETILGEEQVLRDLYAPLARRIDAGGETMKRLSFTVKREVDVAAWAGKGESLLDLRVDGPFKGSGTLEKRAREALERVWAAGTAEEMSVAMSEFLDSHRNALLDHSPALPTQRADFRKWAVKLATWLFSTDHIAIRYRIDYDGVDIRSLSPGTRGIVMVLLYLALDDADDRPLIIDQPEENLDPKSIHAELVSLFQHAKNRRQIILVTHNANLVINTDADQIIVASAGPHAKGGLPPISYETGGLEDGNIRVAVCEVLEGGEPALQERARRLRIRLNR